ncbi:unnamed protein product, partial [Ectocarpus fasciculatus]
REQRGTKEVIQARLSLQGLSAPPRAGTEKAAATEAKMSSKAKGSRGRHGGGGGGGGGGGKPEGKNKESSAKRCKKCTALL